MARSGGGTLNLPAGNFMIDSPELQNAPKNSAIQPSSLIVVPPNTTIRGHLDASGAPDSVISWRNLTAPVLLFAKSSGSGLKDLHMQFVGTSAALSGGLPFGDLALQRALGHNPMFRSQNHLGGGSYEMASFAYVIDSDRCTFDNLVFDSATRDNDHVFFLAINLKGKGIFESGGGMQELAVGNSVTNIKVYDYINAFLVAGQRDLTIRNITADRRGSLASIAPGHVIYTTALNQFGPDGHLMKVLSNANVTISNIAEGRNTYSNVVALGTLAIKTIDGGQISDIRSSHPAGLIQTIQGVRDVTFSNLSWSSDFDLCASAPKNCATPVINVITSKEGQNPSANLTFKQITLKSTKTPVTVALGGDNLVVDGLEITTPPDFLPGQTNVAAVVGLRNTTKASIRNYVYNPLITVHDRNKKYNAPLTAWNTASNVSGTVTVHWPAFLDRPSESEPIVRADAQDKTMNNSIKAAIIPK